MKIAPHVLAPSLRQLKPVQLRLLAELSQAGALGLAADRVGISQPSASRLLAEMERLLDLRLHEREGRGLRLTAAGEALARRAARIQIELADAARDLTEAATGRAGTVRVGAVTGPALDLVLPALLEIQRDLPEFRAEVTVATSVQLGEQLREGRLDFALARPSPGEPQLESRPLGVEPLTLVVRRGHPLLMQPAIALDDLLRYDWVMGDEETLLTQSVLARLAELRVPVPKRRISTLSFLFTLAVVTRTDAIAPLATPVVDSLSANPSVPFVSLPLDLGLTVAPFSLVLRRLSRLTTSSQRLVDAILIRAQGRLELHPSRQDRGQPP